MNCSPPGSSVHGMLQARILEWVSYSFSRDKPTWVSCVAGRFFTVWATREATVLGSTPSLLLVLQLLCISKQHSRPSWERWRQPLFFIPCSLSSSFSLSTQSISCCYGLYFHCLQDPNISHPLTTLAWPSLISLLDVSTTIPPSALPASPFASLQSPSTSVAIVMTSCVRLLLRTSRGSLPFRLRAEIIIME